MKALIEAAFARTRVVVMALVLLLAVGAYSYAMIPKEASPEVTIPYAFVTTGADGIAPGDAEELLLKPMEREFSSVDGLKQMTGTAAEGYVTLRLEFEAGSDVDTALTRTREAADRAEADLPDDAYDITVTELDVSLFPIITLILSGPVPERALNAMAEALQTEIEALSGVLEADIGGMREQFIEIQVLPTVFETYQLSFDEVLGQVQANNRLVAAGALDTGRGRLVLKVPGTIQSLADLESMPVKVRDGTVVSLRDVATVRRAFEDPTGRVRLDGQPALSLEVKKRAGANLIATVELVKAAVERVSADWPESVEIVYLSDQSEQIETLLSDLEASVIAAILLVMIVVVWALGLRSALLVGVAIPGSFLTGVAVIWMIGYTLNSIVLFALILVVGMLVDGAIVITDLADRRLQEGDDPRAAYRFAARRMAWPIIASTATTLSVFFPLLFWGGIVGQFMRFLPVTVIVTLIASLLMALIFVPVLGGMIGRRQPRTAKAKAALQATEKGDPRRDSSGATRAYVWLLNWAVLRPATTVLLAVAMLLGTFAIYGQFGKGVEFFPEQEPETMAIELRARDIFSLSERDRLLRLVEERLHGFDEIEHLYARSSLGSVLQDEEIIGTIQADLTDWDTRRTAAEIGADIRAVVDDIAGVEVQVETASAGPTQGKPVSLRLSADDPEAADAAVVQVRELMDQLGGFTDVEDDRSLPGIEVAVNVQREEAARFGADITLLGRALQLLTQGVNISTYRAPGENDSLDIRMRFPPDERTLSSLANLRVPVSAGLSPVSNFVTFEAAERVGTLRRVDERRVLTVSSNVAPGLLVNDQVIALRTALESTELPDGVSWSFSGEAQDQEEAASFLVLAFISAIFLMLIILVTQFNNFYQAFVVLSAIVFSIVGVLLGTLIAGRPFGIVMGGIGVIALAGIVVNNNIVLIDCYNDLRRDGVPPREAALRTGAQRLRPVLLTTATTALGLMPMVLAVNINFFTRTLQFGAPSTQWWIELSTAIAGGLMFATVLTLVVTPAMLLLGERKEVRRA